jgi:hypothetical protein
MVTYFYASCQIAYIMPPIPPIPKFQLEEQRKVIREILTSHAAHAPGWALSLVLWRLDDCHLGGA